MSLRVPSSSARSRPDRGDDPAAVSELVGNGVAIIDVRESDEWAQGHLPGRSMFRAATSSRGSRASCPIARSASCSIARLATLGTRRAHPQQRPRYEHVASMTGGITLWKDRGYEVVVPARSHLSSASATRATC